MMDKEMIRLSGTLFWTVRNGNVYVMLSKPSAFSPFFPAGYFSVPSGLIAEGEDTLDAAMRIGYEKTGVLDNKLRAKPFWQVEDEGLEYTLYALRVSPSVKTGGNASWIRLSDDMEDISALCHLQLALFAESILEGKRKAV